MATGQTGTNFSPTVPHFFTIIVEKTLCNNKVIGLTKSDGKVWIDKGWPEFSKHYSLAFGHFLVFRYEGNSQFQVAIFDKSTIEIDYCRTNNKKVKEEPKDDQNMDTNPRPCSRPRKRMRTSTPHQSHDLTPEGELNSLDKQSEKDKSIPAWRLSGKEKAEAMKRGSGFKSNQPFFVLLMQPSHVQANCTLNVPCRFAKSYLGTGVKYVNLKALNGRKTAWSVKYNNKGFDCKNSKPKFEAGWRAFVRDNGLKRGDVCVFELTKRTGTITFEVSFYRESGSANSASIPGVGLKESKTVSPKSNVRTRRTRMLSPTKSTAKEEPEEVIVEKDGSENEPRTSPKPSIVAGKARALEIASSLKSENPSFTVLISSTYAYRKSRLVLPAGFARTYIDTKKSNATLRISNGRSWSVMYKVRPISKYSLAEFCSGWSAFAQESGLEEGDICTFELIINRDDNIVFKVYIVKAAYEPHGKEI